MDDLLLMYAEQFGEGFPMYQIGREKSDRQIEDIIKRCLNEDKTAYDLGYVTDDLDILY